MLLPTLESMPACAILLFGHGDAGLLKQSRKIFGKRGGPFARLPGCRMNQAKPMRMQGLPRKCRRQMRLAIQGIADQRKTERLHVHAYLVRASGLELTAQQADRPMFDFTGRHALEMRDGGLGGGMLRDSQFSRGRAGGGRSAHRLSRSAKAFPTPGPDI